MAKTKPEPAAEVPAQATITCQCISNYCGTVDGVTRCWRDNELLEFTAEAFAALPAAAKDRLRMLELVTVKKAH